jgi:aspartyl-tRNA(Asn)/glutamyl-tRNA(Gln) amidotransferase subunit B
VLQTPPPNDPTNTIQDLINYLKSSLPPLPDDHFEILTSPNHSYHLTSKDAKTLINLDDGDRVEYYKNVTGEVRRRLANSAECGDRAQIIANTGRTTGNWFGLSYLWLEQLKCINTILGYSTN